MLVPGGIAEMFEGGKDKEVVFLEARKGFVRFAIQHGLDLVPVYGFGENRTFHRYEFWKAARQLTARKLKVALQLYSGRWGTLLPYNVPINVVVGEPVRVAMNPAPTDDEVLSVLRVYTSHLQRLFDTHKSRFSYGDKQLVIV